LWDYARFNRATQPVVGVSWYEAEAYCAWLNHAHAAPAGYRAQLPTREQWMLAARNGRRQAPADAVDYPWGGGFDPALANTTESGLEQTTPVDMYPDGATKADVFDLAGNVWEWTSDLHSMDRLGDIYWLKGGSFWSSANSARSSAADGDVAWGGSYYGGCRVVVVPISRSA
jgi:formylglycine-generating enzyme required for sulfatase activity